ALKAKEKVSEFLVWINVLKTPLFKKSFSYSIISIENQNFPSEFVNTCIKLNQTPIAKEWIDFLFRRSNLYFNDKELIGNSICWITYFINNEDLAYCCDLIKNVSAIPSI